MAAKNIIPPGFQSAPVLLAVSDLLYLYSFYRKNGHSRRRSFKIARSLIQR